MPVVLVIVGVILVITAFNNTHGDFGNALSADIPGFFKWGAAIAAILALGYIPGVKTPSRYLLALVLLVIVLKNYPAILAGFTSFAKSSGAASGSGNPTPTAADTANPTATPLPTQSEIAGEAGSTSSLPSSSLPSSGGSGSSLPSSGGSGSGSGSPSIGAMLASAQSITGGAQNLVANITSGSFNPASALSSLSSIESGFGGAFG